MDNGKLSEADALQTVIGALLPLEAEARERIIRAILAFFDVNASPENPFSNRASVSASIRSGDRPLPFSTSTDIPPKEFMREKQPKTDVERIACLAYYLTHYRDTPHFKTIDLSKLNTDAAQPKFSNAAVASNNALQYGYLAPAQKGMRQISAAGEEFVRMLPDREAAKSAMARARPKRKNRRSKESSEE